MSAQHKILLIRHQQAAKRTQEILAKIGHRGIILPFSQIEAMLTELPVKSFDGLIFSSPVAPQLLRDDNRADALKSLPVYCVGEKTAQQTLDAGFLTCAHTTGDAQSLAEFLTRSGHHNILLYPCAKNRAYHFHTALKPGGTDCVNWEIYQNQLITPELAEIDNAISDTNAIFLFSKRTAVHFFQVMAGNNGKSNCNDHNIIAISRNVATSIPRKFLSNTHIARLKNELSMIECLDSI